MLKLKEGFSGERRIVLPEVIRQQQKEDPLVSSLYITDIGYYPNAENHYCKREKPITEHVLLYCVDGQGHYQLEGHEYALTRSQYVVLPAGKPHVYWSDETHPWTLYWIHFTGAHASYYIEEASIPHDVRPGITSRISDRNNIFEEIFFTLEAGYSQENLRYASSLLHYYLGSMRFLQQYRQADVSHRLNLSDDQGKIDSGTLVEASVHYMKENIESHLSLVTLARYMGYSVSHFSSIFKHSTGQSPLSYFNQLKMKYAAQLLLETDMKVNQICHKVGIMDVYYFSRLFRKTYGIPPTEYRQLNIKEETSEA